MRKSFKALLVGVALAVTAVTAWAPAASAAEKPLSPVGSVSRTTSPEAVATPDLGSVWVHFLPTVESDHLVTGNGDDIVAECFVYSEGTTWDLVADLDSWYAGYTYASYLPTSSRSDHPCDNVGSGGTVNAATWVHLAPHADWEHQVLNPGDNVAAIFTLSYPDSSGTRVSWDLVVDHINGLAGFIWASAWVPQNSQ